MDSLGPLEVCKLARAVMKAMATTTPLDAAALRRFAVDVASAGPILKVALLMSEDNHVQAWGPFNADGSGEGSMPGPLLDGSTHIEVAALPARPTCIASPSDNVAIVRALRALGMDCFTLVPLMDGHKVLGALVLGHPEGQAPAETVQTEVEPLNVIGLHMGTAMTLRKLTHGTAVERAPSDGEVRPSKLNADAMRAIAMTGRLASLGTLAGGLVHEVNNPATFIALAGGQIEKFVNKAQKRGGCEGLEPVVELAEGIRESTNQIRDMVAAFRLLVGVANRSVVVTVDLERVLKSAVELTRAAHRHDAVLETDLQEMPSCPGNYVKLGPVLVNVLVNAIESLRSTTSSPKMVRVEGRVRNCVIQVRVQDTGEGIASSALPHVFDPFFTTRDRGRHAGLGLTIAREAITALNGRIDIESEAGKGTTVRINVPVREATEPTPV